MATMEDIARALGVSKGTVSKALSGADDVSEATRKIVLEKAVELGYARLTRRRDGQRVCIFTRNMPCARPEDFGYDIVIGFRKMAEPAGFSVDIIQLTMDMQNHYAYDEYMLLHGYQGALFLGLSLKDKWMQDFKTCRTPTVLYDNHVISNPVVTYVGVDSGEGMDMAVSCLKALGHEKIGYLSGELGSYIYQQRSRAFFAALRQNGLDDRNTVAGYSLYTSECLTFHLPRILEHGCTAIVCSHDLLAHSVLLHCRERGIRIPEDLSLIGFDDIPLCRHTTPTLSTIRQDQTQLGKSTFYALTSQINRVPISTLLLHAQMIPRGSVGPAPKR